MKLYIRRNENKYGPYPIEQVKKLLQEDRLLKNDQASEDNIAWQDLSHFLDTKESKTSLNEPASIEDLSKESQEIVSPNTKSVIESTPEESRRIAPTLKKTSISSESASHKGDYVPAPKKKRFGVLVFSVAVILIGAGGFILGFLMNSSGGNNATVLDSDFDSHLGGLESHEIEELKAKVLSLQKKVSEYEELKTEKTSTQLKQEAISLRFEDDESLYDIGRGPQVFDFTFVINFKENGSNSFELRYRYSKEWMSSTTHAYLYKFQNRFGDDLFVHNHKDWVAKKMAESKAEGASSNMPDDWHRHNETNNDRFFFGDGLDIDLETAREVRTVIPVLGSWYYGGELY